MYIFDNRDEILGMVIKAMENGGYGAFDTMVAVCEMGALLDNVNQENYAEIYREYLREARYEKNDFRKITYRLEGNNLTYHVIGDIYDKSITEELKYTFSEGRNPENTKEAAVGINFAKQKNIGLGDSIYMIRNGKEMKLNIVGIYLSFRQYGNSIRIVTEDIKEFFKNQADGYYSIVLKDGEDI